MGTFVKCMDHKSKCMGCIICIVCAEVDQLPFAFLGDKLINRPRVGVPFVHSPIVEGGTVDGRNPANQLRLVISPIMVLYIPGGAGFLSHQGMTSPTATPILSQLPDQSDILTPLKTNMAMENPPFEDVCPIEHRDFSNVMLVFRGLD